MRTGTGEIQPLMMTVDECARSHGSQEAGEIWAIYAIDTGEWLASATSLKGAAMTRWKIEQSTWLTAIDVLQADLFPETLNLSHLARIELGHD